MEKAIIIALMTLFTTTILAQEEPTLDRSFDQITITYNTLEDIKSHDWAKTEKILRQWAPDIPEDFSITMSYQPTDQAQKQGADQQVTINRFSIQVTEETDPKVIIEELRSGVNKMLALMTEQE